MDPREHPNWDPYWKLQPVAYTANTELRSEFESLNKDNSHSWVRISHGSNKFVTNLNNNNEQEISEVQLEEYESKLNAKGFCKPIKGQSNHKDENLAALPREQYPLREEFGPMLNRDNTRSTIKKCRRN